MGKHYIIMVLMTAFSPLVTMTGVKDAGSNSFIAVKNEMWMASNLRSGIRNEMGNVGASENVFV